MVLLEGFFFFFFHSASSRLFWPYMLTTWKSPIFIRGFLKLHCRQIALSKTKKWSKVQCWVIPVVYFRNEQFCALKQLSFPECTEMLWNTELSFRESVCWCGLLRGDRCVHWVHLTICLLAKTRSLYVRCSRIWFLRLGVIYAIYGNSDELSNQLWLLTSVSWLLWKLVVRVANVGRWCLFREELWHRRIIKNWPFGEIIVFWDSYSWLCCV